MKRSINVGCRQGRECSALHTSEGGHHFHGGVAFPIEPTDKPVSTPDEAGSWAVAAQIALLAVAAVFLVLAVLNILKGNS
jgi:hypothetical protein